MPESWLLETLLDEERRLRALAEGQVRAYRTLLLNMAMQLAPGVVDARRRADPGFPANLSSDGWAELFRDLLAAQPSERQTRWSTPDPPPGGADTHLTAGLQRENGQLKSRIAELIAEKEQLKHALAVKAQAATTRESIEPESVVSVVTEKPGSVDVETIAVPPSPPSRFQTLFQNWEREGLVLAILATTGWSLRYAVDEALSKRVGIGVGSGSTKRLFKRMEKSGLLQSTVYDVGRLRAAIMLLTEKGKQVVQTLGFDPVPAEWEVLMAEHGGERQAKHAALCCAFSYQVRSRGYTVTHCPTVQGNAQPDLHIERGETSIYIEVEAESGEPERRMRKWRNQADLQGYVALCANTPGVRERLVQEAKAASKHGVATDLHSLIRGDEFWIDVWGQGSRRRAGTAAGSRRQTEGSSD